MVGENYALKFTPCAIGIFISKKTGEAHPASCGSWACIDCGPRKVRRFLARIAPPQWTYMATLTLEGDGSPTRENIRSINASWRVFKRWLERNVHLEDFTWVNEQGKLHSRLHKHALVKCSFIPYRRARAAIIRAGFGPVCDFQPVKTQRNARFYVSKYLSKSLPVKWPKYSRRCQTSIPAPKPTGEYMFQKTMRGAQPTLQSLLAYKRASQMTRDERTACIIERYTAEFDGGGGQWRELSGEDSATVAVAPGQLALIPNEKNCVTVVPQQEGLFESHNKAGP